MQHLTPVGLSKDGSLLVLVSDTGEEFAVAADHRLRTALQGDPKASTARLGQLEMKMESALRPRDIQARIRSGESAEEVADAARTTVDSIMAFAAPVLAERAHVAQIALKGSIRRRTNEAGPAGRTLDEASRQFLSRIGVRADDLAWDAWRREDGRWALVAEYDVHGDTRRAEFTYDQPGRYVVADNDEALLLTGEATLPGVPAPTPGRLLSAVPDDELPLGDDALEMVREPAAAEVVGDPEPALSPTEDLTAAAEAVREAGAPTDLHPETAQDPGPELTFDDLAADHADADWIAEVDPGIAIFDQGVAEEPFTGPLDTPAPTQSDNVPADTPEPAVEPAPEPVSEAAEQHRPKKKGRSSVPSWDEIMFGGGKND